MNTMRTHAFRMPGLVMLALLVLPAISLGQGQGGGGGFGGRPGGMNPPGGPNGLMQIRQILQQLNLSEDQNSKTRDIIQKVTQDARDARQGMRDATPAERMQKMQELLKEADDAKQQILELLTPDQKEQLANKSAEAVLKWATDMLAAVQKASVKMEIGDDQRKQLTTLYDDTSKTLDGYKPEVTDVKDDAAETQFSKKVTKTMSDANQQLIDILGEDDARQLVQSALRSMPGGGRGGPGGVGRRGQNGGGPGGGGGGAQPATQPAPK